MLLSHAVAIILQSNSPFQTGEQKHDSTYFIHQIMSPNKINLIIQQAKNAWINGDATAFSSLFSIDGEFLVPGNRWVGREKIRKIAADFATSSSDVKIEIRRIIIEGNQAVVEWYWENTDNSTGYRNQADDVIVIDFVEGQIYRWREYIDTKTPKPTEEKEVI